MGDSHRTSAGFAATVALAAGFSGCSDPGESHDEVAPQAVAVQALGPANPADTRVFNVKLQPGAAPTLPAHLQAQVVTFGPLFTLPESTLASLQAAAGAQAPDLTRWHRIVVAEGTDVASFRAELRALDGVAYVENAPEGLVQPPALTPDFEPLQGYLNAATDGLDARFAWTLPGGNGEGVTIYDVEYNWNQAHEDLAAAAAAPVLLDSGDTISALGVTLTTHGTNVLGILVASNNGLGVTGMAWGASVGLAPQNTTNLGHNPANAILLAVNAGSPGDIILLEAQASACAGGLGPAETELSVFEATEIAVENGFIIVAAAGNSTGDLDDPGCGNLFDRFSRDSGAILVGAGNPPSSLENLQKVAGTSFGERVDVQGWGAGVVTTGPNDTGDELYVDPDDPSDANSFYYDNFGGTSSASATVAGASAALQGFFKARFGAPLLPFEMRRLLRETGTPQPDASAGQIGPRPNIRAAIESLTQGPIDIMFLVDTTGSYADDLPNFRDQAPAIMSSLLAENSDTRFGLATFRDYPIAPFGTTFDYAYQLDQQLTSDTNLVASAIAALHTVPGLGADQSESQLTALYQLATGMGQTVGDYELPAGQQADFRPTATKLILLWTDAPFHMPGDPGDVPYPGNSYEAAADAILALDPPQVLGISAGTAAYDDLAQIAAATNSFAPAGGVDCDADGTIDLEEGEPLVCVTDTTGAQIGDVVTSLVAAGLTNRKVDVGVSLDVSGAAPPPIQVGESLQITLNGEVFNNGPSSSATVALEVETMFGGNLSVTPSGSSASVDDLGVGDSAIVSQAYTVTCDAPGTANVTFLGDLTLTEPSDSFDPMLPNNTDRAVVRVTCLAPVYAVSSLDIRNRVVVAADVYGGNELRYGTDGNIAGNAVVNGSAFLWSRAHIDGKLTVADAVVQQDGVVVEGGIETGFSGVNLLFSTKTFTTGSQNLTLQNDQAATWTPGSYAEGMVRARATLTLTAGVYNFTRLVVEPDVIVILDDSGGAIEVNVENALEIGDRSSVHGASAQSATFYSNTTGGVRIGTDVLFMAALRAPLAEVHVYSRTTMPARLLADRIIIEPDTSLF